MLDNSINKSRNRRQYNDISMGTIRMVQGEPPKCSQSRKFAPLLGDRSSNIAHMFYETLPICERSVFVFFPSDTCFVSEFEVSCQCQHMSGHVAFAQEHVSSPTNVRLGSRCTKHPGVQALGLTLRRAGLVSLCCRLCSQY